MTDEDALKIIIALKMLDELKFLKVAMVAMPLCIGIRGIVHLKI